MNRQQLIKLAQREISERRFKAEERCESILDALRRDDEFKSYERSLRKAQIDGLPKKEIDDCKKRLNTVLKKHGLDESALTPKYRCRKCGDTGYVNGAVCSCLQNEICRLITAESNVINRNFTFENSSETDKHNIAVYKKAQRLCLDKTGNMLLTGNTGAGKTYLLTACVNSVIDQNRSVMFTTAYSLNAAFLEAHLSDFQSGQSILDALTDVDVLAIDDLGTEIVRKNVTAEYLFTVINERIARRKQTFISTNLSLADIRDRYDERLFSRLVDQNITAVVQLKGSDKRLSAKA